MDEILISIEITLKLVHNCANDDKLVLGQVMAWRRTGDKPLSEPMMT